MNINQIIPRPDLLLSNPAIEDERRPRALNVTALLIDAAPAALAGTLDAFLRKWPIEPPALRLHAIPTNDEQEE